MHRLAAFVLLLFFSANLWATTNAWVAPVSGYLNVLESFELPVPAQFELDAEIIQQGESQLSWADVSGASYYEVWLNGVLYTTTTEAHLLLSLQQTGEYSVQIRACDSQGCSELSAAQTLTVLAGVEVNFHHYALASFGVDQNQDADGAAVVSDDGSTLVLTGNAWKQIPLSYTVTADTVLEFEFSSAQEGEIHAIGLSDSANDMLQTSGFTLFGTENCCIADFKDYPGHGAARKYRIPLGQYYQGDYAHLYFVMDNDATTSATESVFAKIKLFEATKLPFQQIFDDAVNSQADGVWQLAESSTAWLGSHQISQTPLASFTHNLTELNEAADYNVYMWWSAGVAADVSVEIQHDTGVANVQIDQNKPSGRWQYVGSYRFSTGNGNFVKTLSTIWSGVHADAVRLQKIEENADLQRHAIIQHTGSVTNTPVSPLNDFEVNVWLQGALETQVSVSINGIDWMLAKLKNGAYQYNFGKLQERQYSLSVAVNDMPQSTQVFNVTSGYLPTSFTYVPSSDANGDFEVSWQGEKAHYVLELMSDSGATEIYAGDALQAQVTGLVAGQYQLKVSGYDQLPATASLKTSSFSKLLEKFVSSDTATSTNTTSASQDTDISEPITVDPSLLEADDYHLYMNEQTSVEINVLAGMASSADLIVESLTAPLFGQVSLADGVFSYSHSDSSVCTPGGTIADSFQYQISDNVGSESVSATISIEIICLYAQTYPPLTLPSNGKTLRQIYQKDGNIYVQYMAEKWASIGKNIVPLYSQGDLIKYRLVNGQWQAENISNAEFFANSTKVVDSSALSESGGALIVDLPSSGEAVSWASTYIGQAVSPTFNSDSNLTCDPVPNASTTAFNQDANSYRFYAAGNHRLTFSCTNAEAETIEINTVLSVLRLLAPTGLAEQEQSAETSPE